MLTSIPKTTLRSKQRARHRQLVRGIIVLAAIFDLACSAEPLQVKVKSGEKVLDSCPSSSSADKYFSYDKYSEAYLLEGFVRRAKLPPLWCGPGPDVYRFLRVPSYRPAVVVTVSNNADGWLAEATEYADPRAVPILSYVPEQEVRKTSRRSSPAEMLNLASAIDRADFGSSPQSLADGTGFESAPWVIEARVDSSYRAVLRALGPYAQFRDVARQMMRLSGLSLPSEMVAP